MNSRPPPPVVAGLAGSATLALAPVYRHRPEAGRARLARATEGMRVEIPTAVGSGDQAGFARTNFRLSSC